MKVKITEEDLVMLIIYARRYCDNKLSSAPEYFNTMYDKIMKDNPGLRDLDSRDFVLHDRGTLWPYAADRIKLEDITL